MSMKSPEIPYKIYLSEDEIPQAWYNVRADMKTKPAPLLNPGTGKPMTAEELGVVFCDELVAQELDNDTAYIPIPQEIRDFYKMYRPAPLVRAYCLEEKLGTPAHIYYKFEGNNTSGSHKLNSAVAQAYYAKKQGLKGVTTETGAGQWGTALSMACSYFGSAARSWRSSRVPPARWAAPFPRPWRWPPPIPATATCWAACSTRCCCTRA